MLYACLKACSVIKYNLTSMPLWLEFKLDNNKNKQKTNCDDLVQCVPTRKGHHILFKGYTYVFKSRLQCGAEQWCCSYRQKTGCISVINMQAYGVEVLRDFHNHKKPMFSDDNVLPAWVTIYYTKLTNEQLKCNVCETIITVDEKSLELLEHIKTKHNEVYELHKNSTDETVKFHIEFLHLNMLKDDGDPKTQPVILGEVCEAATDEIAKTVLKKEEESPVDLQFVVIPKKKTRDCTVANRRRSWVWKYFKKLSNIIYRCNLCNVVLSIKGCNTNNMNRHVRTRHPSVYKSEIDRKRVSDQIDVNTDAENSYDARVEEIEVNDKELEEAFEALSQKPRRSWIWSYFTQISDNLAQCNLCNRNISHGGNATGNMNRHLKMIHHITGDDNGWVWKVFDSIENDFYSCKICQYKCMKFEDMDRSVTCILDHLKMEHGVVSGDQIIVGTDFVGNEIH